MDRYWQEKQLLNIRCNLGTRDCFLLFHSKQTMIACLGYQLLLWLIVNPSFPTFQYNVHVRLMQFICNESVICYEYATLDGKLLFMLIASLSVP